MPIEDSGFDMLGVLSVAFGAKAFLILFLIFYAVFGVVLYRQVQLMSKKLPTPLSGHLRFISILNIGVSITILFFVIGTF